MTWGGVIKHKKIIIFSVLIIVVAILLIVVINNVTNKSYATANYLYDAVETDVITNGYGGTYTDDHADTTDSDGNAIVGDENIYYYNTRGYGKVKFGDWCWQIIRTTDTGGVKLIYDGAYSSSTKCNNSGTAQQIGTSAFNSARDNAKYAGLKYKTTNENDTNSTILTYLNTWYESNLSSYESYLEDTIFCNDRTGSTSESSAETGTTWYGLGTVNFFYHNYSDSYNKLYCDNIKDRFTTNNTSAQLSHPIGLMSAPEYKLGGEYIDSNTSNVHYTGNYYWLVSPYRYYADTTNTGMRAAGNNGKLYSNGVALGFFGVRPVVSLAPNMTYSSGTGINDNPYIIGSVGTRVKYSAGSYGTLSGTASEEVSSGGHPTGRNVTPNSGYTFIGWVANKNVTLSNNTTITKGTIMTKAQTQSINVTSSITLVAKYYKGWLHDAVKTNATTNGYGGTYTDDHADSVQNDGTAIVGTKNIYYYNTRGYGKVIFAGFCWQIIRTTDTGGVKLIYDGVPSSGECTRSDYGEQIGIYAFNSSYNNAKYVGLKYKTTNDNDTNSTILNELNTWYESNLSSYDSYLENTVFCNDRTGSTDSSNAATGTTWYGEGTSNFYYHNYYVSYNKLYCNNVKDRFSTNNNNAKLSHPIGLMSQPEYLLGGAQDTSNVHYTGSEYWLISPYYCYNGSAYVQIVKNSTGVLQNVRVGYTRGVRPSVSLKPNMTYASGDGTSSSPYIVEGTILEPLRTATFYYQSSSTSGTTNISSVTTSCTPSGGSCNAEIPSAVRSSVGTYNNSYAGLNTSTGSMSTPVNSSATTVTLTSDTTYYAVYRSSVTNYYYSN